LSDLSKDTKEFIKTSNPSNKMIEYALENSKLAKVAILLSVFVSLIAIVTSLFIKNNKSIVAGIPYGETWDYPMVHWVNTPMRFEENAKPFFVAQKYLRGLYEVDSSDFVEAKNGDAAIMLSQRLRDLLNYTVPGSNEYIKVLNEVHSSQALYKMYSECKCVKRFLITDMVIHQSPLPIVIVEFIGRFVMFGIDGQRPVPAEDLGYKSIVIQMTKDLPLYRKDNAKVSESTSKVLNFIEEKEKRIEESDEGKNAASDEEVKSQKKETVSNIIKVDFLNPEGWYVIRSSIIPLNLQDVKDLREIRTQTGMKGLY